MGSGGSANVVPDERSQYGPAMTGVLGSCSLDVEDDSRMVAPASNPQSWRTANERF